MRLFSATLLALLARTVLAQPTDVFETDRFHAAMLVTPANEVTFKPFQKLDWESKAHRILAWLNLERPTPTQIGRLSLNEAAGPQFRSIDFRAPLEASVRRATYLLIYAAGVVPLQPVELEGSVDFRFDTSMTTVEQRTFSGSVVAHPTRAVTDAAFAIIGNAGDIRDVDPHARYERRRQAGPAVYDFVDGPRTATWTTSSKDCSNPATSSFECLDAASAVSFRIRDEHLLLVKWKYAFCESSYTLFLVGATLKPLAGNSYGCDV